MDQMISAPQSAPVDVTMDNFMAEVIEGSKTTPTIVQFWAPWCGPCKQLGPVLEKVVGASGGKVRMVRVNIDDNQQIAQQMRVQSVPTVYGFVDGQPVINRFASTSDVPASTPLSDQLSKDMKRRGFSFVGSTIIYAFMQGIGMVNDHVDGCWRRSDMAR